jgi:ABC-2 type transport system permease protein
MLRNVGLKTLYDQRRGLLAWAVSLALLVGMYISVWPSMGGSTYKDMFDQMPEAMKSLFASNAADLGTATGFVQVELMSFMGPMLVLIYAINAGAAAIAGEEDRHTLDLLLANPVSRTRIVLDKLAAMTAGVVLLSVVMGLALMAGGPLTDMHLPGGGVTAAMLHMGLLGLVFGALALAMGAMTGHAAASRAVPAVVAVLAYVVNGLAPLVSWLEPLRKFSPFYQYSGHDPLLNGISVAGVGVALGTIAVLAAVAVWGFSRRDVAA